MMQIDHSLYLPGVLGWEAVAETANTAEIQKRGCQGLSVLLGDSASFQSDVENAVKMWNSANASLLHSTAIVKHKLAEQEMAELTACIESASCEDTWVPESFSFVRKLQNAGRNYGSVDLMQCFAEGSFVAVKRMPRVWTGSGFHEKAIGSDPMKKPREGAENIWLDVGIAKYLNSKGVPFACKLLGVFFSRTETFVVSSFATEGDLFEMSRFGPSPGERREDWLRPLVQQTFDAVVWLHDRLIAHCDISMENILVTREYDNAPLQVKLIDFGMASCGKRLIRGRHRGKPSYRAPEMFQGVYDPFLADVFALGVVIYSTASTTYPWMSTKPGSCPFFACACAQGLESLLMCQAVSTQHGNVSLIAVLSEDIVKLLCGLLAMSPWQRLTLSTAQQCAWLR
eukprot:TRINITY_DN1909_c0_g1_i1.p1 TRINITY_DN1909_c0_g1~~TRINITY_DN1909_c0_g1_i1.p1  ORF type:complete len:426 (-),score=59.46 TRINITY_DN1909_c0_g1_i1:150-1346(-)